MSGGPKIWHVIIFHFPLFILHLPLLKPRIKSNDK